MTVDELSDLRIACLDLVKVYHPDTITGKTLLKCAEIITDQINTIIYFQGKGVL